MSRGNHLEVIFRESEDWQIAQRLRAGTTMTLDWIAHRLQAGAPGYLANCLRQEGQ